LACFAEAWRAEVLQFIAENIPKIALTSAFVERLQSEWSLEHIQQIAEAVKLEYGSSRAGYALEVYLGLQRLQASTESGSFSEAEAVKELLDSLKVLFQSHHMLMKLRMTAYRHLYALAGMKDLPFVVCTTAYHALCWTNKARSAFAGTAGLSLAKALCP